ncbi:ABC transporter ATP-binding protein [Actinomycetospora sp. CA-101289]|uniref:ABC transporter ATP-binding protein n=1 Tax=Actinomycetospora sp. CA-101289 TaxID=3239893 RepID=UPI003D9987E9
MPRPPDISRETRAEDAELARRVSLRRVARLFRQDRRPLAVVVAVIVASSIVAMASPFLLRAVIDDALPHRDLRLLVLLAGGMIAVAAVTAALGVVQTWISTGVGQRVMHRLRTDVFAHLQRQSLGFFTRTRTGEVQSRITNDIGGMQTVVTSTATSIAANLTTVVATAVAMVALSWQLSLVTLVVLPPAVLVSRRVARMRRELTAARQRELADLNVTIEEGLSVDAASLHRTLGTGPALVERFTASSARLTELELRSQLAGRWRMATMGVVFAAIPALIYVGAGLPWTVGALSIGTLVAFTSLQAGVFRPLSGLLDVGVQVASSLALFARIFEYQDLVVEIADPEHPVELHDVRGDVRIEGVTFTHPGGDRPALDGVDLAIPAGTTLALVGETGSGKTTLGALVARLHDPDAGRITIDGVDLRDMRLADLAGIVGVVSQETYLLHTTVRENLRAAKPDATDTEIEAAARAARIHDVVAGLSEGYDTMVGARGHRFSGGEKQRLAIARTLLRDPRVLVLDEATSALDTGTERAVQLALDDLARHRTTLTIAHRLSTVRHADGIAVLDHGRVVETGTHAELVGREGRYAALAA